MQKSHWIGILIALLVASSIAITTSLDTPLSPTLDRTTTSTASLDLAPEPAFFAEDAAIDTALGGFHEPLRGGITANETTAHVIQTGYLTLEVRDVYEGVEAVTAIAASVDGFVQNTNAGEYPDGSRYGSITIRVPAERYNDTMRRIREAGLRVVDESSNAQDVTEQYTDLEARLRVAQEQEGAYLSLLDRATSVSDLLEVQRELSTVRANIERLQGQIQYYDNRTELSTITVSFTELASVALPTKPFQPGSTVQDALQSVVVVFQWLIEAIIWIMILGIGVALPLSIIGWLIHKGIKKRNK